MLTVIIPIAGEGSRFISAGIYTPKPLIEVAGKTLIEHSITTLGLDAKYIFITKKYQNEDYNKKLTSIFTKLCPNFLEVTIDFKTSGAAATALFAEAHTSPDSQLIVTNSDQYFDWSPEDFTEYLNRYAPDALVGVYESNDPKNSFAEVINGKVIRLVEKVPVSTTALTGFHYWKNASSFFESAKELCTSYIKEGYKEPYVSLTYNHLINQGMDVALYQMPGFYPLGTPEDLEKYRTKLGEK